jgi:hypothetical protein
MIVRSSAAESFGWYSSKTEPNGHSLCSLGPIPSPIVEQVLRLNSAMEPATVRWTVFLPALLAMEYEAGLVRLAAAMPSGLVCVLSMMRNRVEFDDFMLSQTCWPDHE